MDALHRITPAVGLGDRVVVRHRLADGSATDAIGWVVSLDEDAVALHDHLGSTAMVDRSSIVAARRLPVARGGRDPMRTSPAELQQVALHGWLADSEPLGEWTLRAAAGFTGRANSCLAVGDPGVPVAEAAERIVTYAARHGARPWAQVVAGSEQEEGLRALGWRDVYVATDVLVARLSGLLEGTDPHPSVAVDETLPAEWERTYQVSRPNATNPTVVRRLLESGAPHAYASVLRPRGLIAIGRGHVWDDWLGLAAIWTAAEHRRQGWAAAILAGLGHWGARRGARHAYLQVATDNEGARRAYEPLGFRRHHGYRYLAAPGE